MVARRSATGRRPVADGCRDDLVARRFWLLQVKPLCDQIDRRKVFGGRRLVADWLVTHRRLVAAVADNPDTDFSRRLIADRLPTDLQIVADFLKSKTNAQDTVANQSPTDRQSVPDRSPTDRRLIAD